jgi:pimeloyl-ACP methyl ester carboxylesterase
MHIAEQGDGPLVLLLHGWPQTWYSWRHQIDSLAAAGYRVVAPDQRGYGTTDRPDAVDQYSIFHLVGDVVALIHQLGAEQAAVVGHDWGSIVVSHTAVLRPDLVRGLACLAIPPIPRGRVPPMTETEQRFGKGFYQNYFQEPGVAEASLAKDVAANEDSRRRGVGSLCRCKFAVAQLPVVSLGAGGVSHRLLPTASYRSKCAWAVRQLEVGNSTSIVSGHLRVTASKPSLKTASMSRFSGSTSAKKRAI